MDIRKEWKTTKKQIGREMFRLHKMLCEEADGYDEYSCEWIVAGQRICARQLVPHLGVPKLQSREYGGLFLFRFASKDVYVDSYGDEEASASDWAEEPFPCSLVEAQEIMNGLLGLTPEKVYQALDDALIVASHEEPCVRMY